MKFLVLLVAALTIQPGTAMAKDFSVEVYSAMTRLLQLSPDSHEKVYVGNYKSAGDCKLDIKYGGNEQKWAFSMDLLAGSNSSDWQDIAIEPPYYYANTLSVAGGILTSTQLAQESIERGFFEISTNANGSFIPYIRMGGNKFKFLPFNMYSTCRDLKLVP